MRNLLATLPLLVAAACSPSQDADGTFEEFGSGRLGLAAGRDRSLVYESRRVRGLDGAVWTVTSGDVEAIPTEVLELATGVTTPDRDAALHYSIEAFSRQTSRDGAFESGYAIVASRLGHMSVEDRVSALQDRRPLYGDAAVEQQATMLLEPRPLADKPAIDAYGRQSLADWPAGSQVVVRVCGEPAPDDRLPDHALFLEVAFGWDRQRIRQELERLKAERAQEVEDLQAPLLAVARAHGGSIVGRSRHNACVDASLPKERVAALASADGVREILVPHPDAHGVLAESDGESGVYGTQIWQYWSEGDPPGDGGAEIGGTPTTKPSGFARITAAIVDGGFQDNHNVLKDEADDPDLTRVFQRWNCHNGLWACVDNGHCDPVDNLPWQPLPGSGDHGTGIASILVGDLTDDQEDPDTVPVAEQQSYSGYAGEAGLILLQPESFWCSHMMEGVETAAEQHADLLSLSLCEGSQLWCGVEEWQKFKCTHSCQCRGDDVPFKVTVNDAFKDGLFVVKAAGNQGAGIDGCCSCTVTSPGSAVGAFTVGGTAGCHADHNDVRRADIFASSSHGGGEIGRWGKRSVVDLVAPAGRRNVARCEDQACPADDYNEDCRFGTSYATPAVAAAAVDFKDNWIENNTPVTWLDNAHRFKTLMLLMGDRWDGDEYVYRGFHPRWGGGRLKMRKFDQGGMDWPWEFRTGAVDLFDGKVYERWLSDDGSPVALPVDADALKVVVWWYEPMTGDGEVAADIVLKIQRYDETCTNYEGHSVGDLSWDMKKMVFRGDLGGALNDASRPSAQGGPDCWKLRIEGWDITPNDEEANLRMRRVHWAFYWEDTDRDDWDGKPSLNCPGAYRCDQVDPGDIERP